MKNFILVCFCFILLISNSNISINAENVTQTPNDITPTFNQIQGNTDNLYVQIYNTWANLNIQYNNGEISLEQLQKELNLHVIPYIDTEEDIINLENSEREYRSTRYIPGEWSSQHSREIALCSFHPISCNTAYKLSNTASISAADRYKDYTLWQGNGDAYRHAYWSALMTKHISRDFAYDMGLAHEGLTRNYTFSSQNSDKKMDISNNYYGRKKGTSLKGYSDSYIGKNIADNVSNGNLKRIRLYSSGGSTCDKVYQGICTNEVGYYHKTSNGGRYY